MIVNPMVFGAQGAGGTGGAETVIGTCKLYDGRGGQTSYPIYQGIEPLDGFVMFKTMNSVVQANGDSAEFVGYGMITAGDFMFFRGVKDGDSFQEEM